jgi:hypothetical protein
MELLIHPPFFWMRLWCRWQFCLISLSLFRDDRLSIFHTSIRVWWQCGDVSESALSRVTCTATHVFGKSRQRD